LVAARQALLSPINFFFSRHRSPILCSRAYLLSQPLPTAVNHRRLPTAQCAQTHTGETHPNPHQQPLLRPAGPIDQTQGRLRQYCTQTRRTHAHTRAHASKSPRLTSHGPLCCGSTLTDVFTTTSATCGACKQQVSVAEKCASRF